MRGAVQGGSEHSTRRTLFALHVLPYSRVVPSKGAFCPVPPVASLSVIGGARAAVAQHGFDDAGGCAYASSGANGFRRGARTRFWTQRGGKAKIIFWGMQTNLHSPRATALLASWHGIWHREAESVKIRNEMVRLGDKQPRQVFQNEIL